MAYSKKKSCAKRKSCTKRKACTKGKELKVGSIVSFYNVKSKCKVKTPIKGFIKRSIKNGREVKLAHGKSNGTKVYRIVSNTKKRSTRH